MKPDILTRFEFNNTVIVEIQSDYTDSVMVEVFNNGDSEHERRSFQVTPDELDVFIAALNLYKNRIRGGWSNND